MKAGLLHQHWPSISHNSYSSHKHQSQKSPHPSWEGGFLLSWLRARARFLPTAVWSCSGARTTAVVFRKKHLKDIRRLGSDFKWKLDQGVKRLCSSSHYSLLLGVWFYLRVTDSKRQLSCEDRPCKHNLWLRKVMGETCWLGLLCQVRDCKPEKCKSVINNKFKDELSWTNMTKT